MSFDYVLLFCYFGSLCLTVFVFVAEQFPLEGTDHTEYSEDDDADPNEDKAGPSLPNEDRPSASDEHEQGNLLCCLLAFVDGC